MTYKTSNFTFCDHCGSTSFSCEDPTKDPEGFYIQEVKCCKCKAVWFERFKMNGVKYSEKSVDKKEISV